MKEVDMKRKKLKILFFVLLVVLSVSGCGKKESKETKDTKDKKETVTKEEDPKALPKEKQMAKDIDSFGANVIDMPSGYYKLSTLSVKIDKAKQDEEQYLVYCTATQESEMFKANNHYVMTYNYYDIGGWVLDECVVEEVDMIPQCCMSKDDMYIYAMCGKGFNTLEQTKVEKVSDEQYICRYTGTLVHAYMTEVYTVEVNCLYDNTNGWQAYGSIVSSYCDWSDTYGVWYGEWAFGGSKMTYTINVKEINEKTGTVKCDIKITREEYNSTQGETVNTSQEFKDTCGKIEIDDNEFHQETGIEYLAEMPISFLGREKITVYWGRKIGLNKVYFSDGSQPRCTKIN